MINAVVLAAYTIASVAGILLLKISMPVLAQGLSPRPWTAIFQAAAGAVLYVIAFAAWLFLLSKLDVSVAFPIAFGLTLVFATLISIFFLEEPVGILRISGIILVFFGVALLSQT